MLLETPFLNASGCNCTNGDELEIIDNCEFTGGCVSKSSTVLPRDGNLGKRYYDNEMGSINSMGIPNLGYQYYLNYSNNRLIDKPFIQSIAPLCIQDLEIMLTYICLYNTKSNYYIELNLSCPNVEKSSPIGYDFKNFDKYLEIADKVLKDKIEYGIKLPPYFTNEQFNQVANIIRIHNVSFLTCIKGDLLESVL